MHSKTQSIHIGDLIFQLSKALKSTIETDFKHCDIGFSQLQVLMTIKRLSLNGTVTQERLTEALPLDKSNISRQVRKLQEQNYLSLQTDSKDSRKIQITLTPIALNQLNHYAVDLQKINARLLANIAPENLQVLENTLKQALFNLQGDK